MTVRSLTKQAGFSLLEAMIAAMILGIVLASVLTAASHCFRYVSDIRRMARSSQILQQKMEDIRLLSWTDVNALPGTFTDPSDTAGLFNGKITKTTYDTYGGTPTVLNVTLSLTWKNSSGRTITNNLSSLISNGGLNKYIF